MHTLLSPLTMNRAFRKLTWITYPSQHPSTKGPINYLFSLSSIINNSPEQSSWPSVLEFWHLNNLSLSRVMLIIMPPESHTHFRLETVLTRFQVQREMRHSFEPAHREKTGPEFGLQLKFHDAWAMRDGDEWAMIEKLIQSSWFGIQKERRRREREFPSAWRLWVIQTTHKENQLLILGGWSNRVQQTPP